MSKDNLPLEDKMKQRTIQYTYHNFQFTTLVSAVSRGKVQNPNCSVTNRGIIAEV